MSILKWVKNKLRNSVGTANEETGSESTPNVENRKISQEKPLTRKASKAKPLKAKVVKSISKKSISKKSNEFSRVKQESENHETPTDKIYPESFFEHIPENADQFPNADINKKPEDAYVGFDFGTSSAKVIIQMPYSTGNPAFAVPFGSFSDPNLQYLLPTRLFVDSISGICSLQSADSNHIELAAIKAGLMENPNAPIESVNGVECSIPVKYIATAYIALALRYVRCWFLSDKEKIYGDKPIKWSLNLGLPAAKDDDVIRNDFAIVGKAAWIASLKKGAITIADLKKSIEEVEKKYMQDDSRPIDFSIIPEVIAEAHGYSQTVYRRNGLHILVDVGATTLDINGFKLFEDNEENKYSIILADVANWGAVPLHMERIKMLESLDDRDVKNHSQNFKLFDSSQIIPDSHETYIPSDLSGKLALLNALRDTDKNFIKEKAFNNYLAKMLNLLRRTDKRSPYLVEWTKVEELDGALPVILCGGASVMSAYKGLIEVNVREWIKRYVAIDSDFDVLLIKIIKPEKLDADVDDASFHRLAVAWGLSHPPFEVGEYFRPSDIDISRETISKDYSDNYIGPEQM